METHKYKVFINGDCNSFTKEDISILNKQFKSINLNGFDTFYTLISFTTYKSISNRHSIPDENEQNKNVDEIPLSEFMKIDDIKLINHFDYVGEKIHSIINQEKSWEADDFEVSNPKDVIKVAEKFRDFIKNKKNDDTIGIEKDIALLINLAKISNKYNKELYFYDGYFWQ